MRVWKQLTQYKKFRDETGYHADFALESEEGFYLIFGPPATGMELKHVCPKGKVWLCHFELAVEEFDGESVPF